MRYVKKYESFKQEDSLNEEFLGALYNAAKGALKSFLGNIAAPFKTLKDDFKKGMEKEQVKRTMIAKMDSVLKASITDINKAEDVAAVTSMREDFKKTFTDQVAEFDKEIKIVKESRSINEGKVQDALIGARVALDMVVKKAEEVKKEYDAKFVAAKDLAGQKKVVIDEITKIINEFKKTIMNNEIFKKAEEEYKKTNQIVAEPATDYKVGDELIYLRKNKQKSEWDALTDEQKKAVDQKPASDIVFVDKVEKIEGDNFSFKDSEDRTFVKTSAEIISKSEIVEGEDEKKLQTELGTLKELPEQMKRVVKFVDFIKTKPDRLKDVDTLLGDNAEG